MKRKTKNILMIVGCILLIASMIGTMVLAKNNLGKNNFEKMDRTINEMGEAPSMPNGDNNMGNPPEMPDGDNNMGNPPEMPDGDNNMGNPPEMPNGDNNMGNPPEMPSGDNNMGNPPEKPNGDNNMGNPPDMFNNINPNGKLNSLTRVYYVAFGIESLLLASLAIYLILSSFNQKTLKETFTSKDKKAIYLLSVVVATALFTFCNTLITNKLFLKSTDMNFMQSSNISYSAVREVNEKEKIKNEDLSSENQDENVILVNGAKVGISNVKIQKTGDSDGGDDTSFYGINSAILARNGATVTIQDAEVTTDAVGANGVFSYGGSATTNNSRSDGTTINISGSTITTKKDNSGGIMTTGGGIMNATNLTILTSGTSSAAIRSDRGGGTVIVDNGTYKTTGQGSPTIYSTANITVKNATLEATASEGVVVEGNNSIVLENVHLTDTNNKLNGQSTTYKNIFLYQSMSGDASEGTSSFKATNSTITTNKGDTIYVTNTTCTIDLSNNTFINNDSTGNFLRAQKDSWGNSGSNGGNVTLNMNNQKVEGNIVIDSISTLTMNMKESSYYEGTINGDNTAKEINLSLDASSTIQLTADSYVSSFTNENSSNSNIHFNGYKLYVGGTPIN